MCIVSDAHACSLIKCSQARTWLEEFAGSSHQHCPCPVIAAQAQSRARGSLAQGCRLAFPAGPLEACHLPPGNVPAGLESEAGFGSFHLESCRVGHQK